MSGLPKSGTYTDSGLNKRTLLKESSSCSEEHSTQNISCNTDSVFNDFYVKGKGDTTSILGNMSCTFMTSNILRNQDMIILIFIIDDLSKSPNSMAYIQYFVLIHILYI